MNNYFSQPKLVSRIKTIPDEHEFDFSYILGLLKSYQNKYAYISDEEEIVLFDYLSKKKGINDLHVAHEKKYLAPYSYAASKSLDINLLNKINSM